MSRVDPEIVEDIAPTRPLARLDPALHIEQVIESTASMKKFRKLALDNNLLFHAQGTLVYSEPTVYLSKSKEHNIGDLKDEAFDFRMISLAMTNAFDFGAQATWYETFPKTREGLPKPPVFAFNGGNVGGQRSGHRPPAYFSTKTGTTKFFEEITRCLTA